MKTSTTRLDDKLEKLDAIKSGSGRQRKRDRMSQTERRWAAMYPHHRYEAITLHLENGHSYTPDFYDRDHGLFIEIKGGYRLGSYQRARIAFDQAIKDFPEYHFAWYEWNAKTKEFEQK